MKKSLKSIDILMCTVSVLAGLLLGYWTEMGLLLGGIIGLVYASILFLVGVRWIKPRMSKTMSLLAGLLVGLAAGISLDYLLAKVGLTGLLSRYLEVAFSILCTYVTWIYLSRKPLEIAARVTSNGHENLNNIVKPSNTLIDESVLADGRILAVIDNGFLPGKVSLPEPSLKLLKEYSEGRDEQLQIRGRRGLMIFEKTRDLKGDEFEIIPHSEIHVNTVVELANQLGSNLMTLDPSTVKEARDADIHLLNLKGLAKTMRPEILIGQKIEIDLMKPGKEIHQGVGYLEDGSMVVVNDAVDLIGKRVAVQVIGILPSAGGKMIFTRLTEDNAHIR